MNYQLEKESGRFQYTLSFVPVLVIVEYPYRTTHRGRRRNQHILENPVSSLADSLSRSKSKIFL